LQIVTGSYERVLHGFTVSIAPNTTADPDASAESATFSDTFLFSAHASSVRSLAISQPTQAGKRILATGSSDERVNLYQISSSAPSANAANHMSSSSSLLGSSISENPRNRELGSLLHHSRTVTRLSFPTKSKLFSAAEDNTIAITRVRDWTMLSSIKAPVPKQHGRPSGDTAAPGEVPAGVNDFAIHPSMKLMISVGKGERCMRLWNLVTGKKAGVLNFDKSLMAQAGEGKFGTGEGRRVVWSQDGEKFVVLFERGAVVYNMDSEPVAVIKSVPTTKIHQARFVPTRTDGPTILAVSTDNGRIMFFDLDRYSALVDAVDTKAEDKLPVCACVAQIESATLSSAGRIKDFELLEVSASGISFDLVFVTASSDGAVRLWGIQSASLTSEAKTSGKIVTPKQVGTLLGVRETGNRLTCLTGFVMDDAVEEDKEEDIV
ncbi:WD40 repeat-like protein, partial [Myriangium duriaei CBS 260.36]